MKAQSKRCDTRGRSLCLPPRHIIFGIRLGSVPSVSVLNQNRNVYLLKKQREKNASKAPVEKSNKRLISFGSPGWIRTSDHSINSRFEPIF
jgi:hypothetical protein